MSRVTLWGELPCGLWPGVHSFLRNHHVLDVSLHCRDEGVGVGYTQFKFTVVDHNSAVSVTGGGGVSTHLALQRAFDGGRAAYYLEMLFSSPSLPYDKKHFWFIDSGHTDASFDLAVGGAFFLPPD